MRGFFIIALLLVTLGSAYFIITNNPSLQKQVSNFIPWSTQTGTTEKIEAGTVVIKGFRFNPETITIKVGDSVTWKNEDSVTHVMTDDNGAWDTGSINPGTEQQILFTSPGTYSYHCTPHPFMKGKIIVTE